CLFVIDVAQGVTAMDRSIAQQVLKECKPCLVVANKFDLFHPSGSAKDRVAEAREMLARELFFLHYAPMVAVSAKKGEQLNRIFGGVERILKASDADLGTGVLNRFLRLCVERNPAPVRKNRRLNLLYATLRKNDRPRLIDAPKLLLFVNHADLLTRTYQRYLENEMRKEFDLTGLPLDFQIRSRSSKEG
ncbi:MAG: GTP-binding protein, partial [Verrucomicrobiota bacterium]